MTETTDIATLPPADRALIALNSSKTEEHLRELANEAASVLAVIDPAGREQAHRLGMKLRTARTTIEKTGKAAREDAQAFSKAVVAEEKRLIAITEGEEKRVLGLRDEFDARLAAEKAAKEAAERARLDEIRTKIDAIRRLPLELANETADDIAVELDAMTTFVPSEDDFAEFTDEAKAVRGQVIDELVQLLGKVRAREQAASELAAERAELERVKAELAAERAAIAAEREALAAAKPATIVAPEDLPDAAEIDPPGPVMMVEEQNALVDELEDRQPASDWTVRQIALATSAQFAAMAAKVEACGVPSFAHDLLAIAYGLREGDHDARIAAGDWSLMLAADRDLIDATVNSIDALDQEGEQIAAE